MRLNEDHILVVKRARALMEASQYEAYICHAIGRVLMNMAEEGAVTIEQANTLKNQLSTGILAGISSMVTLGGFLIKSCPVLNEMYDRDLKEYHKVMHWARLAWLDLIIHTGEIKADKLLGED